jgi:hypothetical protein
VEQVLFVAGTVLVVLGFLASAAQLGNLLKYRRLRALERRGVEGQAESVSQDWMDGRIRVFYRVLLPEGERGYEFYELTSDTPDPMGTVFPVVYDSSNPGRAKLGTLADVDSTEEGQIVKYIGGGGVLALGMGLVLMLAFAS